MKTKNEKLQEWIVGNVKIGWRLEGSGHKKEDSIIVRIYADGFRFYVIESGFTYACRNRTDWQAFKFFNERGEEVVPQIEDDSHLVELYECFVGDGDRRVCKKDGFIPDLLNKAWNTVGQLKSACILGRAKDSDGNLLVLNEKTWMIGKDGQSK